MQGHQEIEIKLRVADVIALKKRLRAANARLGKRVHEFNVLFDTLGGRFRGRDELVRLRMNDGKPMLTFKGRSVPGPKAQPFGSGSGRNAQGKGKYKVRLETEFAVSDPGAAEAFLRGLGLAESYRYEKYRTEIHLAAVSRAHVYLDETPIGEYLEIEGSPVAIDRAARTLGYTPASYITKSYLAIYAEHCRARRVPMGDFVFAHRKKSRHTSVLR